MGAQVRSPQMQRCLSKSSDFNFTFASPRTLDRGHFVLEFGWHIAKEER